MWWPFWNATSADQSTCKVMIQPFDSDASCMGSCTVLLEPLFFSMHTTMGTECPPELVENHDVTLFIDRHCFSNIILKANGPIMPCFNMATHAVHFTECSDLWRTSCGAWDPQNTEFLLLTWPDREKWASSMNHTF